MRRLDNTGPVPAKRRDWLGIVMLCIYVLLVFGAGVGVGKVWEANEAQPASQRYDINRDGKVDAVDLLLLKRHILGLDEGE